MALAQGSLTLSQVLSLFSKEPLSYALRPVVKRAILTGIEEEKNGVPEEYSDIAYYRESEALFLLRALSLHCEKILESCAYRPVEGLKGARQKSPAEEAAQPPTEDGTQLKSEGPFEHSNVRVTRAAFQSASAALQAHRDRKLEALRSAGLLLPRFERLVDRLGLSPKETLIFQYLLCKNNCGDMPATGAARHSSYSGNLPSALIYADMDVLEMMEFMRSSRKHMKEGLIPNLSSSLLSNKSQYELLTSSMSMTMSLTLQIPEIIKALMGEVLTEEELLKFDKTSMMEILQEEPDFKDKNFEAAADDGEKPVAGGLFDLSSKGLLAGLSGDGDLYELIQQEVKRDSKKVEDNKKADILPEAVRKASLSEQEGSEQVADVGAASVKAAETASGVDELEGDGSPSGKKKILPYTDDLDYLEDNFKLVIILLKLGRLGSDPSGENEASDFQDDYERMIYGGQPDAKNSRLRNIRELRGRERLQKKLIEKRLALTAAVPPRASGEEKEAGAGNAVWKPRLERLVEARQLAQFERLVLLLLVGMHVSPAVNRELLGGPMAMRRVAEYTTVSTLLLYFLPDSLKDQIAARKYFYKSGRLVKDGIITLAGTDFSRDITDQGVTLDRRMLDFLVGLDTEFSDMVDGSHLYFPTATLPEDVVLPDDQKRSIVEAVESFSAYRRLRRTLKFEENSDSAGRGLVLLFHGEPGVGKTMMANAVAHHVNKKVLLINFPSLGLNEAGSSIRFIFREAKIHDALLFFDECEAVFEDRELRGSSHVNMLLTEIEKHDGIIVMATNRPQYLDEAMHRRITMTFEFRRPDHMQRQRIWRNQLPSAVPLAADVDIPLLALKFEFSGGYIRNAVQAALSRASARDETAPTVTQADLMHGAQAQLRGALRLKDMDRRRIPTRGLDDVLLPTVLKEKLWKVVHHEKARAVLCGQWGFGQHGDMDGTVCLFSGPPGTGKTLAAEAVGFETGKQLKVVNCAGLVSKWVGDTPKNIDALFEQARGIDAVLVQGCS